MAYKQEPRHPLLKKISDYLYNDEPTKALYHSILLNDYTCNAVQFAWVGLLKAEAYAAISDYQKSMKSAIEVIEFLLETDMNKEHHDSIRIHLPDRSLHLSPDFQRAASTNPLCKPMVGIALLALFTALRASFFTINSNLPSKSGLLLSLKWIDRIEEFIFLVNAEIPREEDCIRCELQQYTSGHSSLDERAKDILARNGVDPDILDSNDEAKRLEVINALMSSMPSSRGAESIESYLSKRWYAEYERFFPLIYELLLLRVVVARQCAPAELPSSVAFVIMSAMGHQREHDSYPSPFGDSLYKQCIERFQLLQRSTIAHEILDLHIGGAIECSVSLPIGSNGVPLRIMINSRSLLHEFLRPRILSSSSAQQNSSYGIAIIVENSLEAFAKPDGTVNVLKLCSHYTASGGFGEEVLSDSFTKYLTYPNLVSPSELGFAVITFPVDGQPAQQSAMALSSNANHLNIKSTLTNLNREGYIATYFCYESDAFQGNVLVFFVIAKRKRGRYPFIVTAPVHLQYGMRYVPRSSLERELQDAMKELTARPDALPLGYGTHISAKYSATTDLLVTLAPPVSLEPLPPPYAGSCVAVRVTALEARLSTEELEAVADYLPPGPLATLSLISRDIRRWVAGRPPRRFYAEVGSSAPPAILPVSPPLYYALPGDLSCNNWIVRNGDANFFLPDDIPACSTQVDSLEGQTLCFGFAVDAAPLSSGKSAAHILLTALDKEQRGIIAATHGCPSSKDDSAAFLARRDQVIFHAMFCKRSNGFLGLGLLRSLLVFYDSMAILPVLALTYKHSVKLMDGLSGKLFSTSNTAKEGILTEMQGNCAQDNDMLFTCTKEPMTSLSSLGARLALEKNTKNDDDVMDRLIELSSSVPCCADDFGGPLRDQAGKKVDNVLDVVLPQALLAGGNGRQPSHKGLSWGHLGHMQPTDCSISLHMDVATAARPTSSPRYVCEKGAFNSQQRLFSIRLLETGKEGGTAGREIAVLKPVARPLYRPEMARRAIVVATLEAAPGCDLLLAFSTITAAWAVWNEPPAAAV